MKNVIQRLEREIRAVREVLKEHDIAEYPNVIKQYEKYIEGMERAITLMKLELGE